MKAFAYVTAPLIKIIQAYRQWPLFRGCLRSTITLPFSCSYVAVSRQGDIFMSEFYNHCVHAFATDGTRLHTWGSAGSAAGQFRFPSNVAVTPSGEVLVTDTDNHRVQVFRADGTLVRVLGSRGWRDGQLHCPRGVAVTKTGEVVVADRLNHRIQVFQLSDGAFLRQWGVRGSGTGQFDNPVAVCVTPDDRVIVADECNDRVQVFGLGGNFLHQWHSQCPRIVTVRGHEVWVVDELNRIQVFQPNGTFVSQWRSEALDRQNFAYIGLAVTCSGHVLVCEQNQMRMYE